MSDLDRFVVNRRCLERVELLFGRKTTGPSLISLQDRAGRLLELCLKKKIVGLWLWSEKLKLRWRYYKHLDEYWAFEGNVPVFSRIRGVVKRFRSYAYPLVTNCIRNEVMVVGWTWELFYPGAGVGTLHRSSFYHKFRNAMNAVEYYAEEIIRSGAD